MPRAKTKSKEVAHFESKAPVDTKRRGNPAWQKGVSGNPGGLPAGLGEVKKLARAHTANAIATLAEIMMNSDAPAPARIGAATALLDRGYGRPVQQVEAGKPGDFADLEDAELDAFIMQAATNFVENRNNLN